MVADNVQLVNAISKDLPAVRGDSTRLMQVLMNLVRASLKLSQAGAIRVCASHTHKAACVVVTDTGPGLTPEQLSHALDPFQLVGCWLLRRSA
jgi:signal transduction histidine kinase